MGSVRINKARKGASGTGALAGGMTLTGPRQRQCGAGDVREMKIEEICIAGWVSFS